MGKPRVLVVEDDLDIQQLVSYNLIKAGFNVSCADTGDQGLEILGREAVDLVLLDLMLPDRDGMEVCSIIREHPGSRELPIIMMTARGEEEDIVTGLAAGADDYVTKPFSPRVLIARVQAVLRRRREKKTGEQQPGEQTLTFPSLVIHPGRHEVLVEDTPVHLTTTEFALLVELASRPGWVFSRQQLIDAIRGYDYLITPRAIDVQIYGLRKKLGRLGGCIETVRGVGYRFRAEDRP